MGTLANSHLPPEVLARLSEIERMHRATPQDAHSRQQHVQTLQKLLQEAEAFALLRKVRWPKGIVCPRCSSHRIRERQAPRDNSISEFGRHYECLDCRSGIGESAFHDLTGMPIDSLGSIQKWAICWIVLGFCSPSQAAELLGLSLEYLLQVAALNQSLEVLPLEERLEGMQTLMMGRKRADEKQKKAQKQQEEETIRAEKDIFFSPRHKSRF